HITRAPVWEATWLNEGLSHLAEELMFFHRSATGPGTNLTAADLSSTLERDAFRQFHLDNLDRLTFFLDDPDGSSLMGVDGLATRGATWSFLRYATDRLGAAGPAFLTKLVRDSRKAGLDNLAT